MTDPTTTDQALLIDEALRQRAALDPAQGATVDQLQSAIARLWSKVGLTGGGEALASLVALLTADSLVMQVYEDGDAGHEGAAVALATLNTVRMALVGIVDT